MDQQFADPFANFDPMAKQPSSGGKPQLPLSGPEGHPMIILSGKMESLKNAADGSKITFEVKLTEPQHNGMLGQLSYNIGHVNPDYKEMAQQQLTSLTRVLGYRQPMQSMQQVFNKPFRGVVDYQKGNRPEDPGSKGYTQIKYVLDINGKKADDPQAGLGGSAGVVDTSQVAATQFAPPANTQQQPKQGQQQFADPNQVAQQQQFAPQQGQAQPNQFAQPQQQQMSPEQQQFNAQQAQQFAPPQNPQLQQQFQQPQMDAQQQALMQGLQQNQLSPPGLGGPQAPGQQAADPSAPKPTWMNPPPAQ